jgi:hypothetical protein
MHSQINYGSCIIFGPFITNSFISSDTVSEEQVQAHVHLASCTSFKVLTALSSPSMMSMKKKSIDQKFEPGRVATASGYTWNTRPGPNTNQIYNNSESCLDRQKLMLCVHNTFFSDPYFTIWMTDVLTCINRLKRDAWKHGSLSHMQPCKIYSSFNSAWSL